MSRRTLASILASLTLLHLVVVVPATVSAGGGCHGPVPPPGDDQASVVKIDGCMFYPTIARVPVGTSVRFVNSGEVPHNVTGVGGTWRSQDLASGAEYRHTFAARGVYPFACTLHPGMNGAVVVGDLTPAAAVTTGSAVSSGQPPEAAATDTATGTEWAPIVMAALGGLGGGVIVGTLIASALLNRRRSSNFATD
jgi:plastocyanin